MPLQTHTRLTPLSFAELKAYEENGFVIVHQALSGDLVDMFNAHIYTIRAQSVQDMPAWAAPKRGPWSDADRFTIRVFNPHLHDGFSLQMLKHPVVRGALAQILGAEAVGVQSMYFYKEPGAPGQAAHQDYFYIKNEPNKLIAAWIALEDVDVENGCLWAIPGSHRMGLLPHGKVKNIDEHEPWTDETEGVDLSSQVPLVMGKGDIVFFDNLLIHSSNKNRSEDRWRRSYVGHYIRHDSRIEREDLKRKISLV